MFQVELSPKAILDLEDIDFYGQIQFGHLQSLKYKKGLFRLFKNLGYFPHMGIELKASNHPEWRKFSYGVHVVVYSIEGTDKITIRRIFSARTEWMRFIDEDVS